MKLLSIVSLCSLFLTSSVLGAEIQDSMAGMFFDLLETHDVAQAIGMIGTLVSVEELAAHPLMASHGALLSELGPLKFDSKEDFDMALSLHLSSPAIQSVLESDDFHLIQQWYQLAGTPWNETNRVALEAAVLNIKQAANQALGSPVEHQVWDEQEQLDYLAAEALQEQLIFEVDPQPRSVSPPVVHAQPKPFPKILDQPQASDDGAQLARILRQRQANIVQQERNLQLIEQQRLERAAAANNQDPLTQVLAGRIERQHQAAASDQESIMGIEQRYQQAKATLELQQSFVPPSSEEYKLYGQLLTAHGQLQGEKIRQVLDPSKRETQNFIEALENRISGLEMALFAL